MLEEAHHTEALLLSILPRATVRSLKHTLGAAGGGGGGGAGYHPTTLSNVTIFFTDMVGFTSLSSTVPAAQLVALLNELFSAIDRCVDAHGLEKIKTLGDAYMACGGVPVPVRGHAARIVRMALEAVEVVRGVRERSGRDVHMRIGVHTGSVTAGVMGATKFVYDVWGDDVDIANKMEATGRPGLVHITKAGVAAILEADVDGPKDRALDNTGGADGLRWRLDGSVLQRGETVDLGRLGVHETFYIGAGGEVEGGEVEGESGRAGLANNDRTGVLELAETGAIAETSTNAETGATGAGVEGDNNDAASAPVPPSALPSSTASTLTARQALPAGSPAPPSALPSSAAPAPPSGLPSSAARPALPAGSPAPPSGLPSSAAPAPPSGLPSSAAPSVPPSTAPIRLASSTPAAMPASQPPALAAAAAAALSRPQRPSGASEDEAALAAVMSDAWLPAVSRDFQQPWLRFRDRDREAAFVGKLRRMLGALLGSITILLVSVVTLTIVDLLAFKPAQAGIVAGRIYEEWVGKGRRD